MDEQVDPVPLENSVLDAAIAHHIHQQQQPELVVAVSSPMTTVTQEMTELHQQMPISKTITPDFATHDAVSLKQTSSIGDADENDELLGEKILQNSRISFATEQVDRSTVHQEIQLSNIVSEQNSKSTQPMSNHQLRPPQHQANNYQHQSTKPRLVNRNHSLPNQTIQSPIVATPQPQQTAQTLPQPTMSTSHDARVGQLSGNVPSSAANVSVVDTATSGQVVTKKKGRFKFVEQIPIQRAPNDGATTDSSFESRQEMSAIGITSSSSAGNLHMIPPMNANSCSPPGMAQDGQVVVTTPSIQKKGRFVVTTLPMQTSSTVVPTMTSSLPQQQPMLDQNIVQPLPQNSTTSSHNAENGYSRNPIEGGMNSVPVITAPGPNSGKSLYSTIPLNDGVLLPVVQVGGQAALPLQNDGITNSVGQIHTALHPQPNVGCPPPFPVIPPPPTATSNGQSPIQVFSASNVTSESHSYSVVSALPYSGTSYNTEESLVSSAIAQYEAIPASSSRQSSPMLTSAKPTTARQSTSVPPPANTTPGAFNSSQRQQQQQGFGKMLYFLDQMKLEVTDADQKIKSLQTDARCLVRFV
jgi:hypothetical protein